MATLSQDSLQQGPGPRARETTSEEPLSYKDSGLFNREVFAPSSSSYSSFPTSDETPTSIGRKAKHQPWRAVWPAPREPASQVNIFGFKKGEVMIFDGNAGNFFARDAWTIEQEVAICSNKPGVGRLPET